MPFVAECPSCGQKLKVPDNLAGKKVRCSKCQGTFTAEGESDAMQPAAPRPRDEEPRERRDDDIDFGSEEEERPRRSSRRSSRRDDDDFEREERGAPGRGGMVMTFGIVSLAIALFALLMNAIGFVFGPALFCGVGITIFGLIFGIMAWAMGGGDLKNIRAGRIRRSAEGGTKTGYITGIIGTILNALQLVCGCVLVILVAVGVAIFAGAAAQQQQNQNRNAPFGPPPVRRAPMLPPVKLTMYVPTNGMMR